MDNDKESFWNPDLSLKTINAFGETNMSALLDIIFTEIGNDYLKATMPVDHRTMQPFGLLHGGASAVLAETMGSVASHCLPTSIGTYVGLEVTATHLRSGKKGMVTGVVTPIKIGKNIHVWCIEIYQEDVHLCHATLKTMLQAPSE